MTADWPTGTVTFLFTDIEGSTRLRQAQPEAYEKSLAVHNRILDAAMSAHGGKVFKVIGDAYCAAFATSQAALQAAIEAQHGLLQAAWGPARLSVRMALHTGMAELRNGDYWGFTLARVARLLPAGHGGQILVSSASEVLLRDHLTPGVSLRDLGERRLKDLAQPERIFDVSAPGLPAEHPPLRTLDALQHNLPVQLTSFVGRQRQLADLRRLLGGTRLLTLVGPGGSGKSRLAVQVAAEVLESFEHGAWLVELAPLTDPGLVPGTVVAALNLQAAAAAQPDPLRVLADHLRSRRLLLILDNCEHLLDACARLADSLLHQAPDLSIVVTSREGLGIAGETAYHVPSLALPEVRPDLASSQEAADSEAVQLFVERAAAARPGFTLTPATAPLAAQICRRLDGIPLAIELAAARMRTLGIEDLLRRLDDRFRLLTGGSRTALPRHQTLKATIDWSHAVLSPDEQALFRRLSVFAGGWTLEAAEAVCGGLPEGGDVLDTLAGLVVKSLANLEDSHWSGQARYTYLVTLRLYAVDKLNDSGEATGVRERHLDYFLAWAEQNDRQPPGAEGAGWYARYEVEQDNVRAALEWALAGGNASGRGLRLAAACGSFWIEASMLSEGRARLAEAMAAAPASPELARARAAALVFLSRLAYQQSDYDASREAAEASLPLWEQLGPVGRQGMARALNQLGQVGTEVGDYASADAYFEQYLALAEALGDLPLIANARMQMAWAAMRTGQYPEAEAHFQLAGAAYERARLPLHTAFVHTGMGELAARQGDYQRAAQLLEGSLATFRERKRPWQVAATLGTLGLVALRQGNHQRMRAALAESLQVRMRLGDRGGCAWCLEKLAEAAAQRAVDEPDAAVRAARQSRATRALAAANAMRAAVNSVPDPADQPALEHLRAALLGTLGVPAFERAWSAGAAQTLEQAVADALAG